MHFVESCTFFRSVSPPTAQSVTITGDKDNIFVEEDRVHTLSDAQSVNVSRCVCVPSGQLNFDGAISSAQQCYQTSSHCASNCLIYGLQIRRQCNRLSSPHFCHSVFDEFVHRLNYR